MKGLQTIACAAAAALVLLAPQAVADPAPAAEAMPMSAAPAPSVAGVAADMSLDAARNAAPSVPWQNEASLHTQKPIAIWADAAFTLEGQPYRVSLRPRPSGTAILRLTSNEQVEKAKVCRTRVVALAAHFDAFFDKMEPPFSIWDQPQPRGATITYNRLPGGGGYVSAIPNFVDDGRDIETLEAGRNARIRQIEYDDTDNIEWTTGQRAKTDYPYALDFSASYYDGDKATPSTCHIEATVTRFPNDRQWPGRPSFDLLDLAKTKRTDKPSATLLHYSLEGVVLPPEGVSLAYRCDVDRVNGRVHYCTVPYGQTIEPKIASAARQRLYAMTFDKANLDPDNDLPLKADLTVKLSPADRLSEAALKKLAPPPAVTSIISVPPPPGRTPVWARSPTGAELSRHYPSAALRAEIEARVVATCVIAADLSLSCDSIEINPPEHTMFDDAARKILALYRAQPMLKNGDDAVGARVRIPIRFELEGPPPAPPPPAP